MKVVPQLLYQHPKVKKILTDGLSCIVQKTMDTIDTNTDHYVAAHVLSVVLKGELNLSTWYEGERFVATENQLVFIPKGRYMISDVIPEEGEFEAVFFFFEDELIRQFVKENQIAVPEPPEQNPGLILRYSDSIRYFTESCIRLYQEGGHHNRAVTKLKLRELLHLIFNSDQKEHFIQLLSSLQNRRKRNLSEFMLLNFDKPLSIEDYAFLTGRSISTFRRDFKRQFSISPKNWLISRRLEKAENLLLSTSLSISQISLEAGYENASHFISAFGKQYGISPKQFLIRNRIAREV